LATLTVAVASAGRVAAREKMPDVNWVMDAPLAVAPPFAIGRA
jgi:hypothetical protein